MTLVDENPLGAGLIGMDVPLLFGNRWTAAVQNQGRMLEQILATNPGLEEAFRTRRRGEARHLRLGRLRRRP